MLRTARSSAFLTAEGQRQALETIRAERITSLLVIGGNGSFRGAKWLADQGVPTIGIPASIDNDVPGTAMAIGVDTALNTVVECLNRIRDTALAHERAFVVEVMGRKSGYIALMGGLAGGAEIILPPEVPASLEEVAERVVAGIRKGKHHSIIIVAEGFVPTDEELGERSPGRTVAAYLERAGTIETRLTILGHLLRGGSPTAFDRLLASRFAEAAVELVADGKQALMTGLVDGRIEALPLDTIEEECLNVDRELLKLSDLIAT
jgi:6-phosphofructokinase 1